MNFIETNFNKKPDLNAVLLLIGLRELGTSKTKIGKEEKVELMHIAVCKLLSYSGYYVLDGLDNDGWPHWKKVKQLPHINLVEQDAHLKHHIIHYFESENIINFEN